MGMDENSDIIAFGMTRQVVIDAVNDIMSECAENEQDSKNNAEYAQHPLNTHLTPVQPPI